jgi:hypothetical protein
LRDGTKAFEGRKVSGVRITPGQPLRNGVLFDLRVLDTYDPFGRFDASAVIGIVC